MVNACAGAVGSVVGQIAKIKVCFVYHASKYRWYVVVYSIYYIVGRLLEVSSCQLLG